MSNALTIRPATEHDFPTMWAIFHEIILAGDTYVNDATFTEEQAQHMWLGPTVQPFVTELDGTIVGAYKILPNMPGRGSHIANGSYIVDHTVRGHGIGRRMVEHSLVEAKQAGYTAIQFNCVVSTNRGAIKLYQDLGFTILATIPAAFDHPTLGYVDTHVMHRSLYDIH